MRIGLQVPSFTWPGGEGAIGSRLADIARTADQAGFYSFWVMDHFFQIQSVGKPEEPMMEAYSTLSYVAGLTQKVKLGTMVTGVIYRYPGILVKTVTTLDVLSGGRAYLGIGAAWNEQEARGLGVPFPPVKERFEPYIAGMEVGNAFTELNDPEDQFMNFLDQQRQRAAGDVEAQQMDEDYVQALKHGLPPTGGLGLGVDRMAMLFTDQHSIRDVVLYPQLRT